MKKELVKIAKLFLRLLNKLIPKNNYKIIFKSVPDYTGNCKALSDYITTHKNDYKIIWLFDNLKQKDAANIKWVKSKTFAALYHIFTSRYVVTTHNELVSIKSKNQENISLWHGMPLKKICYLASKEVDYMEKYTAKRIATSEIMKSIISASFYERADNVYITGQPRNDFLFERKTFPFLPISHEYKKIVLYAPTFRFNAHSTVYSDGEKIDGNNFFRFEHFNFHGIFEFLEKNNILMLVKLHPFEEKTLDGIVFPKNIRIIKSDEFNSLGYDVNHLLSVSDCLLTDYSSIYFDYLILNKPIGFVIPDLAEYANNRGGFTLEPADFWMSGKKILDENMLLHFLQTTLVEGIDEYEDARMSVNNALNTYKDNKNCERVFDCFFKVK